MNHRRLPLSFRPALSRGAPAPATAPVLVVGHVPHEADHDAVEQRPVQDEQRAVHDLQRERGRGRLEQSHLDPVLWVLPSERAHHSVPRCDIQKAS